MVRAFGYLVYLILGATGVVLTIEGLKGGIGFVTVLGVAAMGLAVSLFINHERD